MQRQVWGEASEEATVVDSVVGFHGLARSRAVLWRHRSRGASMSTAVVDKASDETELFTTKKKKPTPRSTGAVHEDAPNLKDEIQEGCMSSSTVPGVTQGYTLHELQSALQKTARVASTRQQHLRAREREAEATGASCLGVVTRGVQVLLLWFHLGTMKFACRTMANCQTMKHTHCEADRNAWRTGRV